MKVKGSVDVLKRFVEFSVEVLGKTVEKEVFFSHSVHVKEGDKHGHELFRLSWLHSVDFFENWFQYFLNMYFFFRLFHRK